jgi:hypothetical protein
VLQFLDGSFAFGVGFVDRHDCIVLGHHVCSFAVAFFV